MTAADFRRADAVRHAAAAGRRRPRLRAVWYLTLLLAPLVPNQQVDAQQLALKRQIPSDSATACPSTSRPAPVPSRQRQEAERLSALGREAALTGDNRAARDFFRKAAQADPTNENIAYDLARASEALADAGEAVRAYCRYLGLAADRSDAQEVRERIARLSPVRWGAMNKSAATYFRSGLEHYDRGSAQEAEFAFSNALTHAPQWADAYYNRALVHVALGDRGRAIDDLRKYLELRPQAADEALVRRQIESLRGPLVDPATAFGRGFLLPGLGQMYTKRPALGVAVLGGVIFAGIVAVQSREVTRPQRDPFRGRELPPYSVGKEYPYFVAGVATAAAITVGAALEAYLYAKRARDDVVATDRPGARSQRVSALDRPAPLVAPSEHGTRVGVSIRFERSTPARARRALMAGTRATGTRGSCAGMARQASTPTRP